MAPQLPNEQDPQLYTYLQELFTNQYNKPNKEALWKAAYNISVTVFKCPPVEGPGSFSDKFKTSCKKIEKNIKKSQLEYHGRLMTEASMVNESSRALSSEEVADANKSAELLRVLNVDESTSELTEIQKLQFVTELNSYINEQNEASALFNRRTNKGAVLAGGLSATFILLMSQETGTEGRIAYFAIALFLALASALMACVTKDKIVFSPDGNSPAVAPVKSGFAAFKALFFKPAEENGIPLDTAQNTNITECK